MIIGAEWDYLLQGLKCRLLFCPFAAGALTHTARQVIWFQKLLPDLKDKQASNCETGRGKRPAQLLLHTHTLTHTQTRTHSGMKDVMSIDNDNGNLTGMFNSGYRSLSHLHTHACVETERQMEINSFSSKSIYCHLAALGPVHRPAAEATCLCASRESIIHVILPAGAARSGAKCSWQRVFVLQPRKL